MNRRNIIPVALGIVIACGLAAPRAFAADPTPVLHLKSGDHISGRWRDSADAAHVVWQSEAFAAPLTFPLDTIQAVQFPADLQPHNPEGPYCFELADGDALFGSLVALHEREAVIQSSSFGTLHIDRAILHRFYRSNAADLIFAGPNGLTGWSETGPAKAWREEGGQLLTNQPGATLQRDFRAPALARYEIELSWSTEPLLKMVQAAKGNIQWNNGITRPNFVLALGVGDDPQSAKQAFRLEVWDDELIAVRETKLAADLASVQKLPPGAGRLHLQIYLDQEQGRMLVFSAAGEKLADLTVPNDKAPSKPAAPGGVQLVNRRGDIKLERLWISRVSNLPQGTLVGEGRVHQTDGTMLQARLQSYDAAAKQFVLLEQGRERRLAEAGLRDALLSAPSEVARRTLRALQSAGARISGDLVKVEQGKLWLKCPGIREPLATPLDKLHSLIVLAPAAGSDEPAAREGRLELAGVLLHGHLLDAREGATSSLVFQPRRAISSSPLARGVSGRLVYRDAPPPAKTVAPTPATPAVRILNGVRTLLGTRPTAPQRIAQPTGAVIHLRSGDALTCKVQSIDENGVTLTSDSADARFVPHEEIKALELDATVPAVKIDKTKKERLLTLPRMQRNNPPTHLIRSLEGDYLRGRLLDMDDKQLRLELRLENKAIPRDQVARIIWLHADEMEAATPASRPADAPAGTRVQAVPRTGNRLTFVAEQLSGDTLSGRSSVLGACRVNLPEIDQLLIGDTIEQAASALAFHQWKLRPAPDPLPTPEPGEAGSGEGLESVLVGKPAPAIELDLLDGSKFRLADRKGKVVLLDFWASWCGPCLQAMPQIDRVAREFADSGVQLVAINLEETPERVKTALDRLKLEPAVALDRDGRVAERYGATSIPQTVIIDREGNVARLFVGAGARFDEQLRQALKAILAGRPDAGE